MKVVAFITDSQAVDRIIDHLKLTFATEKPPPEAVHQELLCSGRKRELYPLSLIAKENVLEDLAVARMDPAHAHHRANDMGVD